MTKKLAEKARKLMSKQDKIRNIGIVAHIDHGKTTLTDNLLAGAGMISEELAGKQLFMDFYEQERERGITIYSANVSMIHEHEGKEHLINLIDTPGHVDFGGDVTRAMRAVDGAIVVVDAVEGVMPQTETVLRQALQERVKPILFINKVDRMIKELKLDAKQIKQRFVRIIAKVNSLIKKYAEEEYKDWTVQVEDGSAIFGSALLNWAISAPHQKEIGLTVNKIMELCLAGEDKEIWKKAPVYKVLLDSIVKHLPSPREAQQYRIEQIWPGDPESEIGSQMERCDPEGKLAGIVTNITMDPHAGRVAVARIFSGSLAEGNEVWMPLKRSKEKLQQVSIYKGKDRMPIDYALAGNIVGITGLKKASSGSTLCEPDHPFKPFELIQHLFEPVVTKAIEAEKTDDLVKVMNFLKQRKKEDPTLEIEVDPETGQHKIKGLGETHINAKIERPLKEKGLEVKISKPIVSYRESVKTKGGPTEGKSPNKHNKFYLDVSHLPEKVVKALESGKIQDQVIKKKKPELTKKLQNLGLGEREAKGVKEIHENCIYSDVTRGIQYLHESEELILKAFEQAIDEGPLARERCSRLLVRLVDAKLHEDAIHRGPAQVIPAVRFSIRNSMLKAEPTLLEPKQIRRIDTTEETMGDAMKLVSDRRGKVEKVSTSKGAAVLKVKMPVTGLLGFEGVLKSATRGRGFQSLIDQFYEEIPESMLKEKILSIRKRKGLKQELPSVKLNM